MDDIHTALMSVASLLVTAITKIFLALLGVFIVFLIIPKTRTATYFIASVLGSIAGCIILQAYSNTVSLSTATLFGISFGLGLSMSNFFIIFKHIYKLMSEDQELMDTVYTFVRQALMGWFNITSIFVSKKKSKDLEK